MPRFVDIRFQLDEDVTPEIFASKVALACSHGALRPGEALIEQSTRRRWTIGEPQAIRLFGHKSLLMPTITEDHVPRPFECMCANPGDPDDGDCTNCGGYHEAK